MEINISNLSEKEKIKKTIDEFVKLTSEFFKRERIEELAWEEDFSQRESKLTGHLFLSVFVFSISIFGTPTFEQLASLFSLVLSGTNVSRQAIHKRITEKSEKFFERILSMAIEITIPTAMQLEILKHFNRMIIWDSTSFQLPNELAEYFKGSGGDASKSAIKIQFGYDIKSGQIFYSLQDGTSSDSSYQNNFVDVFEKDDLVLRDLGYFNLRGFEELDGKDVYFLSRLHQQNGTLWEREEFGQWVQKDLLDFVHNISEDISEVEVYIASPNYKFKARLVIEILPEQAKIERLRKLRRTCQRQRRSLTDRAKTLAGFNFFISNIPEQYLPKEQFQLLYAVRWQIELVFKSWKSNFALEKFTSKKAPIVKTFLYAKLIFIFLTSKIIRIAKNRIWKKNRKEISEFRAYKIFKAIAYKWMLAVVKKPCDVKKILLETIEFFSKSCIKHKRKDRKLPLEILEEISGDILLNSLQTGT